MCLKVYRTVTLALLLIAGDVESNPGPETNEGMCSSFFFILDIKYMNIMRLSIYMPHYLPIGKMIGRLTEDSAPILQS